MEEKCPQLMSKRNALKSLMYLAYMQDTRVSRVLTLRKENTIMKKGLKRISLLLSFVLLMTNPIFALTNTSPSTIDFTVHCTERSNPYDITSKALSTSYSLNISGTSDDIQIELSNNNNFITTLEGKFYEFTTGIYAGEILGGTFKSNNDISVETVKIETGIAAKTHYNSDAPIICIKVLNPDTSFSYYCSKLTVEQWDALKSGARINTTKYLENGNSQEAYENMVTALCFPFSGSGPIKSDTIIFKADMTSSPIELIGKEDSNIRATTISNFNNFTYSGLQNVIADIRSDRYTTLSDLNLTANVFSSTTKIRTNTFEGSGGWASAYDSQEIDGFRYIVLSVMDCKYQHTLYSSTEDVSLQLEIKDSIYFEYLPGTGEIRYLNNNGLKVNNVVMRITKINGSTTDVFKTLERNGLVRQGNVSVPTLIGLIPKASLFSSLCSVYTTAVTEPFSAGEYSIGQDYADQSTRYNGKVCRAIALDSKSCYIKSVGDYMRLSGEVNTSSAGEYELYLDFYVDGFVG